MNRLFSLSSSKTLCLFLEMQRSKPLVGGFDAAFNPTIVIANLPAPPPDDGLYEDPITKELILPDPAKHIFIQNEGVVKNTAYPTWVYEYYGLSRWLMGSRVTFNQGNLPTNPMGGGLFTLAQAWYLILRCIKLESAAETPENRKVRRWLTADMWRTIPAVAKEKFVGDPAVDPTPAPRPPQPRVRYTLPDVRQRQLGQLDLDIRRSRNANVQIQRLMEQKYPDSPRYMPSPVVHSLSSGSGGPFSSPDPRQRRMIQEANLDQQRRLMRNFEAASPAGMLQRNPVARASALSDSQRRASEVLLSARRLQALMRKKAKKVKPKSKPKSTARPVARKPKSKSSR